MYQKTDKSTQHGLQTPHGYGVPHKMPKSAFSFADLFANLTRQLYPTGRVWWLKKNSIFDRFHQAINRSFIRVVNDANSTIDSVFPDNENFDLQDCELWEYRLGLITTSIFECIELITSFKAGISSSYFSIMTVLPRLIANIPV